MKRNVRMVIDAVLAGLLLGSIIELFHVAYSVQSRIFAFILLAWLFGFFMWDMLRVLTQGKQSAGKHRSESSNNE